jgi:hypothetical protein
MKYIFIVNLIRDINMKKNSCERGQTFWERGSTWVFQYNPGPSVNEN